MSVPGVSPAFLMDLWVRSTRGFYSKRIYMAIYLKRYGLAITKYDIPDSGISGSARFNSVTSWFNRELTLKVKKVVVKDNVDATDEEKQRDVRLYGINRKKLLDRLNAYVCLSVSRKFLAFYSVSFPSGTNDEIIVKIWNSCLTSLRSSLGLKSYIWVMERQGNGTMHYHMLTNDYMPIRAVNSVVAGCIDYYVKRGLCNWGNSSITRYNGVDVCSISKRIPEGDKNYRSKAYQKVIHYVTKYMSKNNALESRRQWHCSRLVSALFVTAFLSHEEVNILFEGEEHLFKDKKVIQTEFADIVLISVIESTAWKDTIGILNEKVYNYFKEHNLW